MLPGLKRKSNGTFPQNVTLDINIIMNRGKFLSDLQVQCAAVHCEVRMNRSGNPCRLKVPCEVGTSRRIDFFIDIKNPEQILCKTCSGFFDGYFL